MKPFLVVACVALAACSRSEAPEESNAPAAAEAPRESARAVEDATMPLPPVATDNSAGPAGTDSYTWVLNDYSGGLPDGRTGFPFLTYGMRQSDEILVNLQCREPGSVTVLQMRQNSDPAAQGPIVLRSGDQRVSLPITVAQEDQDGVFQATAVLPVDHPLLAAFRTSGRLAIPYEGRDRFADAIDESERATVARFFAACTE